jgi:hypothetical protein
MKIELLYCDDCLSRKVALENLETALTAEAAEEEIQFTEVVDRDGTVRLKFPG